MEEIVSEDTLLTKFLQEIYNVDQVLGKIDTNYEQWQKGYSQFFLQGPIVSIVET